MKQKLFNFYTLLVMLLISSTTAWAAETVWDFTTYSSKTTLTASAYSAINATSGSGNLYYYATSAESIDEKSSEYCFVMGGASKSNNRIFYLDISTSGTLTIVCQSSKTSQATYLLSDDTSTASTNVTGTSNMTYNSGTYTNTLTLNSVSGTKRLYFLFGSQCYIRSITWTPSGGGGSTSAPTATFTYGQTVFPQSTTMDITVPAHKAGQDFTVSLSDITSGATATATGLSGNTLTITAPAAGGNNSVTVTVTDNNDASNKTIYTINVKTETKTGITFDPTERYSKLVINANIGSFYGNTALKGFNTYDADGNKLTTASWKDSSNKDAAQSIDYVAGLVAKGIIEAADYYKTTDPTNAKKWYYSIADYGSTINVPTGGGSLDDLNASKLFFGLYDLTKEGGAFNELSNASSVNSTASTKLGNALTGLSSHNTNYSFGSNDYQSNKTIGSTDLTGGWFHKSSYLYQMWCDGAYMGPALLAQLNNYNKKINTSTGDWDLITKQFTLTWNQLWNSTDKLLYHAFTSKRDIDKYTNTWAGDAERTKLLKNSDVYHSASYWGRADGWYFLALIDVLEQMKIAGVDNTANYTTLQGYAESLAAGLAARQDATTGCWYQLLDKNGTFSATNCGNGATTTRVYNFLESSATAIFTAAYLKGIRLGILNKATYEETAKKGYEGIVKYFMTSDYKLYWTSRSAGLGGAASGAKLRDGSNAYYLKGYDVYPTKVSDTGSAKDETETTTLRKGTEGKTLGAFIMAAVEYERAYLEKPEITIATHPASASYPQFTKAAALSVTASASNSAALSYQWKKSSNEDGPYTDIDGATSDSYSLPNNSEATVAKNWYQCVINADGCDEVTSNKAYVEFTGGNSTESSLVKIEANYTYTPDAVLPAKTLTSDSKILAVDGGNNYVENFGLSFKSGRQIAFKVAAGATVTAELYNNDNGSGSEGRKAILSKTKSDSGDGVANVIVPKDGTRKATLEFTPTEDATYYLCGPSDLYLQSLNITFSGAVEGDIVSDNGKISATTALTNSNKTCTWTGLTADEKLAKNTSAFGNGLGVAVGSNDISAGAISTLSKVSKFYVRVPSADSEGSISITCSNTQSGRKLTLKGGGEITMSNTAQSANFTSADIVNINDGYYIELSNAGNDYKMTTTVVTLTSDESYVTSGPVAQKYPVTYEMNSHGEQIATANLSHLPDPLPTPTETGYTFAGWYKNQELSQAATAGEEVTAATTLYAKWNLNRPTMSPASENPGSPVKLASTDKITIYGVAGLKFKGGWSNSAQTVDLLKALGEDHTFTFNEKGEFYVGAVQGNTVLSIIGFDGEKYSNETRYGYYTVTKPLTLAFSESSVEFTKGESKTTPTISAKTGETTVDLATLSGTWTVNSSNTSVATVTGKGAVTINDVVGTAVITVSYAGDGAYDASNVATLSVTVNKAEEVLSSELVYFNNSQINPAATGTKYSNFTVSGNYENVTAVKIDETTCTKGVKMESSTNISFTIPAGTEPTVTLYGTAGKVIKVDGQNLTIGDDGTVELKLSEGSHSITKNNTGTDLIAVKFSSGSAPVGPVAVTGISVDPATKTIEIGDHLNLSAVITPSNATNKTVTWSTSDAEKATVNPSTGEVVAVAGGKVTITATATDGSGVTGTAVISIKPAAPTFSKTSGSVTTNDKITITVTGGASLFSGWGGSVKTSANLDNLPHATTDGQYITTPMGEKNNVLSAKAVIDGVSSDITSATFTVTEVKNYTMTAQTNDANMGTASVSPASVTSGNTATFTASPNTNYKFVNWTDDKGTVVSTLASYTVTPTANLTLTANFAADATASGTGTFILDQLKNFGHNGTTQFNESEGTEKLVLNTTSGKVEATNGTNGSKIQNTGVFTINGVSGVKIKSISFTTTSSKYILTLGSSTAPSSQDGSVYTFAVNGTDGQSFSFSNKTTSNIYVKYITVEYEYTGSASDRQIAASFSGHVSEYVGKTVDMPTLTVTEGGIAYTGEYDVDYDYDSDLIAINDGRITLNGVGSTVVTATITPTSADVKGAKATFTVTSKALEALSLSLADLTINSNDADYTKPTLTVLCGNQVLASSEYTVAYTSAGSVVTCNGSDYNIKGSSTSWTVGEEDVTITVTPTPAALAKYNCVTNAQTTFHVSVVKAGAKLKPTIDMMDEIWVNVNSVLPITTGVLYNGESLNDYFTFTYSATSGATVSGNKNVVTLTADSSPATVTLTITATPTSDYTSIYESASKQVKVHIAELKAFNSVTVNPTNISTTVGTVIDTPEVSVLDKDGDALDENEYSLIWSTNAPAVVSINANGVMNALSDGTATITVVVTKEGYQGVAKTITVTVTNSSVYKVPTGLQPKNGTIVSTPDGSLNITFGGWVFGTVDQVPVTGKQGELMSTSWASQSTNKPSYKAQGYDNYIAFNSNAKNPRSEDGNNSQPESVNLYDGTMGTEYSYKAIDPMFNVPAGGSYLVFEPKVNGTIKASIYQNGAFETDTKNGKTSKNYRPQRRVFVVDEAGTLIESKPRLLNTTGKFPKEEKDFTNFTCDLANNGMTNNKPTAADIKNHFGIEGFNSADANFANGVYACLMDNNILKNEAYQEGKLWTCGWTVLVPAPVEYTFDVKAGKTYYLYNFGSKIGFYGAQFIEKDVTVDEVSYADTQKNDETAVMATPEGHVAQVEITGRTIKNGIWNAVVLPFSLNEQQVNAIFGQTADKDHAEGYTQILYFEDVDLGKQTINFTRHAYNNIVAGKPFLIKPNRNDKAKNEEYLINTADCKEFPYVTIESTSVAPWGRNPETASFVWKAGYDPMTVKYGSFYYSTTDGSIKHYVPSAGKTTTTTMKGFRGFLEPQTDQAASSRSFTVAISYNDFSDEIENEETLIEAIGMDADGNVNIVKSGKIYNMNGQLVGEGAAAMRNLEKGIYVVNGDKYVVE